MHTVQLEKAAWGPYFDGLTRAAASGPAIEITSLPARARIEASWIELAGIAYRAEVDCVDIALELSDKAAEEYVIEGPRRIYVHEQPSGVAALEIHDRAGRQHWMEFRKPVPLGVAG